MKPTVTQRGRGSDLAAIRALRPSDDDTDGWAASADGQAVLRDILRRPEQPRGTAGTGRRRHLFMVCAVTAALLGGATTAAVATLGPWSEGGRDVFCARTLSPEADLSQLPIKDMKDFDPQDATRSCAVAWDRLWNQSAPGTAPKYPKPTRFAACYHPNAQPDHGESSATDGRKKLGGPVIYPADGYPTKKAACAAIGSKPVAGG
ncbi:hypothetical protein [Streptomyces sp. ATCC 21386]|uniref:hypothetical protein n=1 Tax=Streptomyces sp. ATCC 21386 TaxID=2699428 RepID=UPI001BFF450B|nr:hypothetical protein [Streptomyces sp. ATCC 21386]